MRSRTKPTYTRLLAAGVLAAATIAIGPSVVGKQPSPQIWNPVKQKMLAGQDVVARRIDSSDPATYCSIASMPGTDFTWTDMVHSGLEFSSYGSGSGDVGAWATWAAPCPTAVARMVGAQIFYTKRVNFTTKAYFRPPDPGANELVLKEIQHATDGGAIVIMINVDNVAQAQQVVQRAYYPPIGARDLGPSQYDTVYPASVTGGNYVGSYNDNVVVIAIIGTVAGVSEANAIAAVPGIHALFLNTMNLESDSGYLQGSQDFFKLDQAVRVATQANQKYLCTADRTATPQTVTCVRHPTGKS
jgi:hypothetical protein